MDKKQNDKHQRTKFWLRIIALCLLVAGITLTVIGFSHFGNFDTNLFSLTFVGLPCTMAGFALTVISFSQSLSRFFKNEHAPIVNEYSQDISPAIRNYASALKEGFTNDEEIVCSCGKRNQKDDKFCSECGKALQRVCPACGKIMESDDKFCSDCGQKLE